jgi:hypothetical protein
MHSQILTDHEREMLNRILEKNEKPKGHRLLKLRVLKYYERLNQDFTLLKKAYKNFDINREAKTEKEGRIKKT